MKRLLILALFALVSGCGGPMSGQAGMYNWGDGTGACTDAHMFGKCKYTKKRQCCAEVEPWKCNCSATCPCKPEHEAKPQ